MIYVDDFRKQATVGRIRARWSHLVADSHDELVEFARDLGLRAEWIQDEGQVTEHFDVTDSFRDKALAAGAKPIGYMELGELISAKRAAVP